MARPKGLPKTGGRQRGTPNKVTRSVREALRTFVEGNVDKMDDLFERVAKEDPAKAMDLLLRASEFCAPKLARTDVNHGGKTLEELICEAGREFAETGDEASLRDAMWRARPPVFVVTGVPDPEPDPPAGQVVTTTQPDPPPPAPPPTQGGHPIPAAVLAQSDAVLRRGGAAPAPRAASAEPYNPLDN